MSCVVFFVKSFPGLDYWGWITGIGFLKFILSSMPVKGGYVLYIQKMDRRLKKVGTVGDCVCTWILLPASLRWVANSWKATRRWKECCSHNHGFNGSDPQVEYNLIIVLCLFVYFSREARVRTILKS